uniref:Retinoblastoma-associated protein A-box domain-containing protein n=1 Tax=Auxenochlorella protothecoides TaxID=3075 RepID=A0A1D2A3S8_AUXPR
MTTSPALHVYADDTSLDATDGWTMPQEPELASRPSGVSDAAGAWIKRICLQHENTSTEALFAHFQEVPKRAELTVNVVNAARSRISAVFPINQNHRGKPTDRGGCHPFHYKCCLTLYYCVLERLLSLVARAEGRSLGGHPNVKGQRVEAAAGDMEALDALLNCCIEVAVFSLLGSRPGIGFPAATKKLGLTNKTYQLWHAIEAFCGALTAPTDGDYTSSLPGMPLDVQEFLAGMQVRIEEELAFLPGSSILRLVASSPRLQPGHLEGQLLASFLDEHRSMCLARLEGAARALLVECPHLQAVDGGWVACGTHACGATRAVVRGSCVKGGRGGRLGGPQVHMWTPDAPQHATASSLLPNLALAGFGQRAAHCLGLVLDQQLQLFFGVHASVVVCAALYLLIKLCGLKVPFGKLVGVLEGTLPNHEASIFQQVLVPIFTAGAEAEDALTCMGARQYYNDIFLPVMSRYPPHELMAQADAQPHVAPLPHTIGPSSKGLTAVPRRVLGDVTNRTPTRLVR